MKNKLIITFIYLLSFFYFNLITAAIGSEVYIVLKIEDEKEIFHEFREFLVLSFQESFKFLEEHEQLVFYALTKKFIGHINTFKFLMDGTNYNDLICNTDHIDHSSAKIILRSALECYVTISYVFWDKPDLTDFRLKLYRYSGLQDRQKRLKYFSNLSHLHIDKLVDEKKLLDQLKDEILSIGKLNSIPPKHLKSSLENGWRGSRGWIEITSESNLKKKYVEKIYSYLSGFTHSGYDCLMQLIADEQLDEVEKSGNNLVSYHFANYLLGRFIKEYTRYINNRGYKKDFDIDSILMILAVYEDLYK